MQQKCYIGIQGKTLIQLHMTKSHNLEQSCDPQDVKQKNAFKLNRVKMRLWNQTQTQPEQELIDLLSSIL